MKYILIGEKIFIIIKLCDVFLLSLLHFKRTIEFNLKIVNCNKKIKNKRLTINIDI